MEYLTWEDMCGPDRLPRAELERRKVEQRNHLDRMKAVFDHADRWHDRLKDAQLMVEIDQEMDVPHLEILGGTPATIVAAAVEAEAYYDLMAALLPFESI